ncbi:serine hydrolase domain-containing protein [Martelella mediterranea]|uniref:Beta-lactamase n=1 Tax=Martelella mediterranea DSM 17316 TaxID=1122214 RepID=A0A1U9Z4I1_9HYPH|nr:serine hydrolase [Martelella mediterranea]AQZ52530.1 Beta-lactamase [Martelella mediterranea DSM 17316]
MKRLLLPMMVSLGAMVTSTALADETRFTIDDFTASIDDYALVDNALFVPPQDAGPAKEAFEGTLSISETPMPSDPAEIASGEVLGKNPQLFPAVDLSFITLGDELVPATQDVIRAGSTENGSSFWDIIVQPGKVWSIGDDGWSRASFPFSLVHMIEGETHNGVAMFLYRDGEISDLRYQILTETAPFYVETYFTAAGSLPAELTSTAVDDADALAARFEIARADAEDIRPWSALEKKVGADTLEGFDSDIRPNELLLDGLMVEDTFYLKSCPTPAGELPYCDRQRFGVWSVSKSLVAAAAMLSVSEKYGPEIFDMTITDLVPEAEGIEGWDKVTVGDALNMATGMGYGQREAEPKISWSPYTDDYYAFYEARSQEEKLNLLLNAAKPYVWGPGAMMRYRDEDMFLVGVAVTNYLKEKQDPDPNAWSFLQANVYEPIGIHDMPINKTIEDDGSEGQPLTAYGLYPTVGDLVKLARLYQNGGRFGDEQILSAEMMADIATTSEPAGLTTGQEAKPYYGKAFWRYPFKSDECTLYFPSMDGWGDNRVMLMPNDITAIRIAANWDGDESAKNMESLIRTANAIESFCP